MNSVANIFKRFSLKNISFTNKSIVRISLGLLLVAIVSSPIGCGSGKNSHFNRPGTYGKLGGGFFTESARGYNSLGHEISLQFRPLHQQHPSDAKGPRNGPVDIQGEVIFSDAINTYRPFLNVRYSDGRYNSRYNGRYDSRYRGGYDYDPCYIEPNQPFRVSLDPQHRSAIMEGNDFGQYELLAYGPRGTVVSLYPINSAVGASFLLGHNNPNGHINVYMDVIVQRIDSVRDCPERQVTFGS